MTWHCHCTKIISFNSIIEIDKHDHVHNTLTLSLVDNEAVLNNKHKHTYKCNRIIMHFSLPWYMVRLLFIYASRWSNWISEWSVDHITHLALKWQDTLHNNYYDNISNIIKQFPLLATSHKHQNNLYSTSKYPMPFTDAKSWFTAKPACQTPTQQVVCVHDNMTLNGAPNMTACFTTFWLYN